MTKVVLNMKLDYIFIEIIYLYYLHCQLACYCKCFQMLMSDRTSRQWLSCSVYHFHHKRENGFMNVWSACLSVQGSFPSSPSFKLSPPSFWGAPISLMSHLFVSGRTFSPSFTRTNGSTRSDTQQGQLTLVQPGPRVAALSFVFSAGVLSSSSWAVSLLLTSPPSSPPALLMVRLRRKNRFS